MSIRIIKQKHEQQRKNSANGEVVSSAPVLIESMLFLLPDQSQTPIVAYEHPQASQSLSKALPDVDNARALALLDKYAAIPSNPQSSRSPTVTRVPVPVHNASQWFSGPDLQNERNGRMEKVVASLVRRSLRPFSNYGYVQHWQWAQIALIDSLLEYLGRLPYLRRRQRIMPTIEVSYGCECHRHKNKDHRVFHLGVRPESYQDFRIETQRMTPAPIVSSRPSPSSSKGR